MDAEADKSPFEVSDFRGGITDDIYNQDYKTCAECDNFVITSDAKLKSRPGSVTDTTSALNGVIPDGNVRIGAMINYGNSSNLLINSSDKFFYRNPVAYTTIQGPTGNEVFSVNTFTQSVSYSQWNRHVYLTSDEYPRPMKIYKDSGGTFRVRTSGLPALASDPTVTAGGAGANTYVYAFHYHYTYTAGPQEFQDFGATTLVGLSSAAAPDINPVAITNIPVISNGVTDNWDTSTIKVFIYRTITGGTTFYKIGEVTNGTTSFNDNFADSAIQTNLVLYTDDGTLDFDPAPVSKFVHVVNSTGYYGSIKDGSDEFPFRIRQSVPGDPDSCPLDLYKDLEDDLMGISSIKSIPIAFCKRHVYRLENNFDQYGRGDINAVRISDTAGCVSHLSIVQAENYCFWAGNDGFYATDGYQVKKISDGINARYKSILANISQKTRIYGKFDELERRVLWGIQQDSGSLDNDSLIILDLRWGVTDNSTFTTWSGEYFRPTALEFFNQKLYRGDTRGYVFIHDEQYQTDPRIDTLDTVDNWYESTIIWTYKTVNINFGSTFFRKMPTRILLTAGNIDNTSIQITAINDDNKLTRPLQIIRWRKVFTWGSDDFVWGSSDCVWNQTGLIEQWRRFPAKGLRLSYVQIIVSNAYSVVANSDDMGLGDFSNTGNTVSLVDSPPSIWPSQSIDYYVSHELDNYDAQYLVTARTSDSVLTLQNSGSSLPTGPYKWLLKGYRKSEPLLLLSYNIFWENTSQTQDTFETGDDGRNQ